MCERLIALLHDTLRELPATKRSDFHVSVYHAMRSEVDLGAFIFAAYDLGVKVCFPCMTRSQAEFSVMSMLSVCREAYEQGSIPFLNSPMKVFSLDDPVLDAFTLIRPETLDLMVVPLVAYNKNNDRLGYGGGNYDTYLTSVSPECIVTGVAFTEQEYSQIPLEPHDFPLPAITTA